MKSIEIAKLPDNARFKLSVNSKVVYQLQRKQRTSCIYTSLNSGRTYSSSPKKIVFNYRGKTV